MDYLNYIRIPIRKLIVLTRYMTQVYYKTNNNY